MTYNEHIEDTSRDMIRIAPCGAEMRKKHAMNSGAVYEIYVDVLYGNCAVMNYLILTLTGILLKRSATRLRRILVSMLCAGISCAGMLLPGIPDSVRSVIGYGFSELLALYLVFRMKVSDGLLHGMLCMYLLTFLYGGCLTFLNGRVPYLQQHGYTMPLLLAVGCMLYELIRIVHSRLVRTQESRARLYLVRFRWREREYTCTGLYDTGNQLYEPIRKIPVCILEQALLPEAGEGCFDAVIPYHSLGCSKGLLYGVFLEQVRLRPICEEGAGACGLPENEAAEDCSEEMAVGRVLAGMYRGKLCQKGSYQMILHPELFLSGRGNHAKTFHDRKEASS